MDRESTHVVVESKAGLLLGRTLRLPLLSLPLVLPSLSSPPSLPPSSIAPSSPPPAMASPHQLPWHRNLQNQAAALCPWGPLPYRSLHSGHRSVRRWILAGPQSSSESSSPYSSAPTVLLLLFPPPKAPKGPEPPCCSREVSQGLRVCRPSVAISSSWRTVRHPSPSPSTARAGRRSTASRGAPRRAPPLPPSRGTAAAAAAAPTAPPSAAPLACRTQSSPPTGPTSAARVRLTPQVVQIPGAVVWEEADEVRPHSGPPRTATPEGQRAQGSIQYCSMHLTKHQEPRLTATHTGLNNVLYIASTRSLLALSSATPYQGAFHEAQRPRRAARPRGPPLGPLPVSSSYTLRTAAGVPRTLAYSGTPGRGLPRAAAAHCSTPSPTPSLCRCSTHAATPCWLSPLAPSISVPMPLIPWLRVGSSARI